MNEDDGVRRVEGGGARHAAEEKEKERGREGERGLSNDRLASTSPYPALPARIQEVTSADDVLMN